MDAHTEIARVVGALAVHVDARHWTELLWLFGPTVQVDYTSLFGGEAQVLSREQLIESWRQLLPGFTRTTHVIGTPMIQVDTEIAHAMASVIAYHWLDGEYWLAAGTYEITLGQIGGAWRITALTLARAWAEGNTALPAKARERAAKATAS